MKNKLLVNQFQFELEKRINGELVAEHMYRCLALSAQNIGFFGFQKFFEKEAEAEKEHFKKLTDICNDYGFRPKVTVGLTDNYETETPMDWLKTAYGAELKLFTEYSELYNQCKDREPILAEALLFFLKEQRTSVGEFGDLIARLELCENNPAALLQFDSEIA